MLPIAVHAQTDIGKEHHTNEDSFAVQKVGADDLLLVVCDGMGGMGRGDEASSLGIDVITEHVLRDDDPNPFARMTEAIQRADLAIRHALCVGLQGRPGCTAVSIYLREGKGYVAWVGDSRVYLVRDGEVIARTRDHKLVEDLVQAGELTPAEAKVSALSSVLTRALGGRKPDGKRLEVSTLDEPWALQPGDWIVLCSDGLCDLVSDEELPELLEYSSPEEACARLVQVALDRGGHDNITTICGQWFDAESAAELAQYDNMRSERTKIAEEAMQRAQNAARAAAPDDATDPFAPEREDWPGADDPMLSTADDHRPTLDPAPIEREPREPAPPTPSFGAPARGSAPADGPPAAPIFVGIVLLGALTWGIVNQVRTAAAPDVLMTEVAP